MISNLKINKMENGLFLKIKCFKTNLINNKQHKWYNNNYTINNNYNNSSNNNSNNKEDNIDLRISILQIKCLKTYQKNIKM